MPILYLRNVDILTGTLKKLSGFRIDYKLEHLDINLLFLIYVKTPKDTKNASLQ